MESSGLRGWIRLVEALWTRTGSVKNGPTRTRNGPKRSKKSKTDQQPGKPLAPISLKAGLLVQTTHPELLSALRQGLW